MMAGFLHLPDNIHNQIAFPINPLVTKIILNPFCLFAGFQIRKFYASILFKRPQCLRVKAEIRKICPLILRHPELPETRPSCERKEDTIWLEFFDGLFNLHYLTLNILLYRRWYTNIPIDHFHWQSIRANRAIFRILINGFRIEKCTNSSPILYANL